MSIYLDNAATSYPKPESVYCAVSETMRLIGASPGRGGHSRSLEATRLLFRAREAVAELFAIPDSSRLVFTHSATESINAALKGILKPGDRVVTTSMEHNALLRPLLYLRNHCGITLSVVDADSKGFIDPGYFKKHLSEPVRMVAVSHVSNVTGIIQDINSLSAVAHDAGALFMLDAAQSAGTMPLDVISHGIDILAAPGHKGLLGPQGTGILYVCPEITMAPLLHGGTGSSAVSEEDFIGRFPEGFEVGTMNLPGIAGLLAGVEYLTGIGGTSEVQSRERVLMERLCLGLTEITGVRLYRPESSVHHGNVLSMVIDDLDPSVTAFALDRDYGIAVRAGLHCAPSAHRTIGTWPEGTIRISPGLFNTPEEIDILVQAVVELTKNDKI